MKKQSFPILVIITVAFAAFTFGYHLGQNSRTEAVTLSIPASLMTVPEETTVPAETESIPEPTVSFPIRLNSAGLEELTALPGIGEVLAQRILDYRDAQGDFTSVNELLNVEGIGKGRFEDIYDLITIGG